MKRIIIIKMRMLIVAGFCVSFFSALAGAHIGADQFGSGANQFEIDFVTISGDSGNLGSWSAGSGYTFSGVNHGDYRMGKFEITNDQWNKFVNINGAPTGNPSNAYDDNADFTGASVPTNNVSWHEAGQFVNWLNTSTGREAAYNFDASGNFNVWRSGDAGYNAANPYRNSNANYFLPSEDEWVKAAYWNGTDLQTYANASVDDLVSGSPDPAKWNYYPSAGSEPWAVGSGAEEINGTYDMMGNVWEWMESPYYSGDFGPASYQGDRGGSFNSYNHYYGSDLMSSVRVKTYPAIEVQDIGFRVTSGFEPAPVPVPGSLTLGYIGIASVGWLRRRKMFTVS